MTRHRAKWPSVLRWAPTAGIVGRMSVSAIALACLGVSGCGPPSSPAASAATKPAGPSKVTGADKGGRSGDGHAEARGRDPAGRGFAEVERKQVPNTSIYGGVVEVPQGGLITVASPFNGVLKAPEGDERANAGLPGQGGADDLQPGADH